MTEYEVKIKVTDYTDIFDAEDVKSTIEPILPLLIVFDSEIISVERTNYDRT